jgi:hypothetical protein
VEDNRLSFDASRDRLLDKAFEDAQSQNQFLFFFILYNLRRTANISFEDESSQIVYDQAMADIKRNYDNTRAELEGSE